MSSDRLGQTSQGGTATLLWANFDSGITNGWTVVDNQGRGDQWTGTNPGGRDNLTGGSAGFAIIDSDSEGFWDIDTELRSPEIDLAGYTNVALEFKTDLNISDPNYNDVTADVDCRINDGAWINTWRQMESVRGPQTVSFSLPQADNQSNVVIRFHYYNAYWDLWWELDDVRVTATSTHTVTTTNMVSEWHQAWQDFDRNYSHFTYKGIDWAPVYAAHSNSFAQMQDGAQFASTLDDILQMLHDWDVAVRKPDGTWLGYDGSVTNNYPSQLLTDYSRGVPYQDVRNAHVLYHAWVGSNLAHLVIKSFDATTFAPITDADLDGVFDTFRNAAGMIVDVRSNTGGMETNAARIASRFTSLARTCGYTRTRVSGNDHDNFAPFSPKMVIPGTGRLFTNPVVCLVGQRVMGTAEWFALMLQASPQTILMGDRTRGAPGDTADFALAGIGVTCRLPRSMGYDARQTCFEDIGIVPANSIPPGAASYSDGLGRDYLLERAMAWLKRPTLAVSTLLADRRVIVRWPGETGYQYTLLRATKVPGPWTLAPGWTSNRAGAGTLMSHTNTAMDPFGIYRVQVKY